MNRMGVFKLAERLRATRCETKVILMSDYHDQGVLARGTREPGVDFIQKPFSTEALVAKVQEALGGKGAMARH